MVSIVTRVFVDANPKELAIVTEDGTTITAPLTTDTTCNEAEYRAVLAAIESIPGQLKILSDSKLVVNQLNHNWNIKEARLRYLAVLVWKNMHPGTTFEWIPREENKAGKVLG